MKGKGLAVLLVGGGLALGVGCAGPREAGQDITAAVPLVEQDWQGVVVSINREANAIGVLATESAPAAEAAWFEISADTELQRDGQRLTFAELSEGDPVHVAFEPAAGPERAHKVELLTGDDAREVRAQFEQIRQQREIDTTPGLPTTE